MSKEVWLVMADTYNRRSGGGHHHVHWICDSKRLACDVLLGKYGERKLSDWYGSLSDGSLITCVSTDGTDTVRDWLRMALERRSTCG